MYVCMLLATPMFFYIQVGRNDQKVRCNEPKSCKEKKTLPKRYILISI